MVLDTRVEKGRRAATLAGALILAPSILVAVVFGGVHLVVIPLFPVVARYYFSQQAATFSAEDAALTVHIFFGSVALVAGAVNIVTAAADRRLRAHRVIGWTYTGSVAISAAFGIVVAFHAYAGTLPGGRVMVTSGFLTLGATWVVTLVAAAHAMAVRRSVTAHRFWMTVNFSLTFAAVVLRVWVGLLLVFGTGTFELLYPTLGWLGWVPNLVVGILIARRLRGTGRLAVRVRR
ncbi:DUF2306 domain-containing protein [Gryllotalpicola ginsengisoli]|uniref:DUF2306 domain-containing protein n=1 Tax=Gryllotalpicola ginsengisoli TaxID=444608 RepID=UPI0003B710B3|nr:DUF2306 domain-containing protein [Gryllotalpicola ginsengisoli]